MQLSLTRERTTSRALLWLTMAVTGFLVLYPVFWIFYGGLLADSILGVGGDQLRSVIEDPGARLAIQNTLVVGVATTVLACIIGSCLAWITTRTDTPFRAVIEWVAILPYVTPPVIAAAAWVSLAGSNRGLLNMLFQAITGSERSPLDVYSMGGLIFTMMLYVTPFVYLFTASSLRNLDSSLEDSAAICGANQRHIMMRIAIPLALPALLSAALIAFVKSIEMFGIPGLIGRPAGINVLTTYIWASLNRVPPSFGAAAILSIVILLAAVVLLWAQGRFTRIGERFVTFTGKGGRARTVKLGPWRYVAASFAITYLVIAVVLPYVVILYGAFATRWGVAPIPANFTLDHFIELFTRSDTSVRAIRNSVFLGIGGASIAILMASLVSYIITKTKLTGRRWLEQVAFLPLAIPGVVLAVGLIWGFIRPPFVLYGTVWILLLGYVIRELPIGSRIMNASLLQIHKDLESAAVVCGAGLLDRLRTIFLPLARSGLVAGWMLLFVAMIRDLSLSMYLYSFNNEVIAVSIFNHAEDGQFNLVYVMAFILAAITLASLVALTRIVGVNPARMR